MWAGFSLQLTNARFTRTSNYNPPFFVGVHAIRPPGFTCRGMAFKDRAVVGTIKLPGENAMNNFGSSIALAIKPASIRAERCPGSVGNNHVPSVVHTPPPCLLLWRTKRQLLSFRAWHTIFAPRIDDGGGNPTKCPAFGTVPEIIGRGIVLRLCRSMWCVGRST